MIKKVFLIIVLCMVLINTVLPNCQAAFNPDDWNPSTAVTKSTMSQTLQDKVGPVLGFIQAIGTVISVIALMIIGFRTLTGSIEEKSAYKESLPGYLIGVFLLFAMTTIPSIIYNIMK